MATTYVPDADAEVKRDTSGIGGQPAGLMTLFFTEMWERFSYYGMRALLMYYMTYPVAVGGLNIDTPKAGAIYGTYTGMVYLMSVPGGWVADNLLGARLSVLVGGIVIALGHFSMAFPSVATFYLGLILIVIGTGLLKPNVSTMVGGLYSETDERRDAGFSIFYMGINLGAFIAPLVCGFLAQGKAFKSFLASMGFSPESSWHWGFAAAGVGMTLGLIQYVLGSKKLAKVGGRPQKKSDATNERLEKEQELVARISANPKAKLLRTLSYVCWGLTVFILTVVIVRLGLHFAGGPYGVAPEDALMTAYPACFFALFAITLKYFAGVVAEGDNARAAEEGKRLAVIGILFLFATTFWMAFEQAGSSLSLFAGLLTKNSIFGWEFPSSWFQSVNSIFLIALAPVFSWLWLRLGNKQPASPAKFALGLIFAGLGFVVVASASSLTGGGNKVGPGWLVMVYLLHTVGELCLSPVGLSVTTKLAPTKLVGLMMGVWFLSISLGNYIGGLVAGKFDENATAALVKLFGGVAAITIVAGLILAAITPYIKRLMGRVR